MITADIDSGCDPKVQRSAEPFMHAKNSPVTDVVFAQNYWPHFPQPLKKGLRMYLSRADESKLIGYMYYRALGCLLGVHGCVVFIFGGYRIIQSPNRCHQRI